MKNTIATGITIILLAAVSAGCSIPGSRSNSRVQENEQLLMSEESRNINLPVIGGDTIDKKGKFSAIYLAPPEGGQLTKQDIETCPEILIVNSFGELKENFQTNSAIWIDRGALNMVDQTWLHEEPQMYCPLVLVGFNDALFSFREQLTGFGIEGPYVDWSERELESGFSIWMLQEKTETTTSYFMKGYNENQSALQIIALTDTLLEGTLPQ